MKRAFRHSICFFLLVVFLGSAPGLSATEDNRLSVLLSSDTSNYGLGEPLQTALVTLFSESQLFSVQAAPVSITGFTPIDIARQLEQLNSDSLSFVLLEQERISIFLFNKSHPFEFIVSSESLQPPPAQTVDSTFIENQFRTAFEKVTQQYKKEEYQSLPSAQNQKSNQPQDKRRERLIAQETRILFRELASQTDSLFHLGAQIGMSRFGSEGKSASVVTFGVNSGYQVSKSITAEVGFNASSYAMGFLGGRYWLTLGDQIVKIGGGLDVAHVFGAITQNSGYAALDLTYNHPPLESGSNFFGPGISFDIPLLGAALRGDLKFLIGSDHSVFIGTYGFVYYL